MEYKVNVTETQWGYYIIEANSPEEASDKYHDGDYDEDFHTQDGNFEVDSIEEYTGK